MSRPAILTLNGGSSSIKFAVYGEGDPPLQRFGGQVERIGSADATLTAIDRQSGRRERRTVGAANHADAAGIVVDFVREQLEGDSIAAVGHRIVHGGANLLEHQRITPSVLAELKRIRPLDPTHLPREIALVEAIENHYPGRPQVACFDTVFHRDLPVVAQLLAIPRRFTAAGIRRFGFHGLSYTYLMGRVAELAGAGAAGGRIVLAHLGSGASMAAVREGRCIDTTMAFTPTAGLVMGTRPGDMDPGLMVYLMRSEGMSPDRMDRFISQECGLLGVSETSADVRDLLVRRRDDPRAADALKLFSYQASKWIGALCTALGGLDTLVFSGGVGEHAPEIRAKICEPLDFLGLGIDAAANGAGADVISSKPSRVMVRVIPTDEEVVIARIVRAKT